MRCGLVLVLLLSLSGSLRAAEGDLGAHLKRVREADTGDRPAALREAAKSIGGMVAIPDAQQANCTALLEEVRAAAAERDKATATAAWSLASPVVVGLKPLSGADAAWYLEHVAEAWKARVGDKSALSAIEKAILVVFDGAKTSSSSRRSAGRTLKKVLRAKGEPERFLAIASGLAKARDPVARSLLLGSLPRKGMSEGDVVAILATLGESGGEGAAVILLEYVLGTAAPVLEAALVGLHGLDVEALRRYGKKILSVTMKDNEDHHREILALSHKTRLSRKEQQKMDLYAARAKAWTTDKLVDKPPIPVPAGVGHRGVIALWWKIIDALEGRIQSPKAGKNARPQILNGRPNIQGLSWYHWWRSAR